MLSIPCSGVQALEFSAYAIVLSVNIVKTILSNMSGDRVREEGTEAVEMEGSSLVLEKNDSEDCCALRPISVKIFFTLIFFENTPLIGQCSLKDGESMDWEQVELTGLAV